MWNPTRVPQAVSNTGFSGEAGAHRTNAIDDRAPALSLYANSAKSREEGQVTDNIELNLEEVRRQANTIRQAGETARQAGDSLVGGTRSNPNFFEQRVERTLNLYAQMMRQLGEGYQQSMAEYAQRLDNAADIFEQAEESQLEILSNARNAVATMPAGTSTGRAAAQRPGLGFVAADGSSRPGSVPPVPLPPSVRTRS